MKVTQTLVLAGLLYGFAVANAQPSSSTLMMYAGALLFPDKVKNAPDMAVFYRGDVCPVDTRQINEGISIRAPFELHEQRECNEMYVVVTQRLQMPEEALVQHFKTSQDVAYRLFKLVRSRYMVEDAQGKVTWYETWDTQELDNTEKVRELADNTVIFLWPAELIAGLEQDTWTVTDTMYKLPRIVLLPTLTEKQVVEAAAKMSLEAQNLQVFHKKAEKHVVQVAHNHFISLSTAAS